MSFLSPFAVCWSLSLSLSLPCAMPQDAPKGGEPAAPSQGAKPGLLTPAEQQNLREKLAKYIADDIAFESNEGDDREKAGRSREKTKKQFEAEWKKHEKKNLLGSMPDLRAVFENCFLVKPAAVPLAALRKETIKGENVDYSFWLPKVYKQDKPHRTLVTVPGTVAADAAGKWTKPADWFASTWDKSATAGDSIFHVVHMPDGVELDVAPDYNREGAEAQDEQRNKAVWLPLGSLYAGYNIDRNRFFIDFGRGACGFGIRFLTLFPDRWAGAIFRQPTAVDDLRIGTLNGVPLLFLRTAATAAVVDALKARIEADAPGSVTVIDATDDYPHKAATPAIEEWLAKQQRKMALTKVVIEPNHDRINRAFWADIDTAALLTTAPADKKPRLEAVADKAANRITVKAVGVERFTLLLNDDLVDLDKDITIVVNDKAMVEKRQRSFPALWRTVLQRNDWECLYPAKFSTEVPKQ
jgi:hypothetical protein